MRENVSNQQTIGPLDQENGSTENCLHRDGSFKLKGRFRDFIWKLKKSNQKDRGESKNRLLLRKYAGACQQSSCSGSDKK